MGARPGWVLGAAVGAVVLLAVVAGVIRAVQAPPEADLSTPEGTVQAFLEATYRSDVDEAAGLLDPEGRCDVEDLEQTWVDPAGRVALLETAPTDTGARVEVEVTYTSGPFGVDTWSETHSYRLAPRGDGWVLLDQPWPLVDCAGGR